MKPLIVTSFQRIATFATLCAWSLMFFLVETPPSTMSNPLYELLKRWGWLLF